MTGLSWGREHGANLIEFVQRELMLIYCQLHSQSALSSSTCNALGYSNRSSAAQLTRNSLGPHAACWLLHALAQRDPTSRAVLLAHSALLEPTNQPAPDWDTLLSSSGPAQRRSAKKVADKALPLLNANRSRPAPFKLASFYSLDVWRPPNGATRESERGKERKKEAA